MQEKLVDIRDVRLNYNKVRVLNRINIGFNSNSIHALIGEHGAGKSSLGLVLCGLATPDSGTITLDKDEYSRIQTKVAKKKGVRFVHQNLMLNPYFSIAETLFFNDDTTPFFSLTLKRHLNTMAERYLEELGITMDVQRLVKDLTLSERALIAILGKIKHDPKVLILDESLDKLSPEYYQKLKTVLKKLKAQGCCIIIMTHKIDWAFDISDRVSIIRDGINILTEDIQSIGRMQIIKMAYTQLSETPETVDPSDSFYHLIKYNEAILENLPVNLIILNNEGILKLANRFFVNNFNVNLKDMNDKRGETLLNRTSETTKHVILDQLSQTSEQTTYHLSLDINGVEGIYNVHYSPIYDGLEKIGSMLIFYDITEYDYLQQNHHLSEKLSSVGLLSAGVAHEINNPLDIISNYLTNIRFRFNDPDLLTIVNQLSKQVTYINKIVSNLQNFSNLEKVSSEDININDLVKEMIDLLSVNAKLKDITIDFIEKDRNNIVYINENEFKQVLLNIIKNSFESIHRDGHIDIILERSCVNEEHYLDVQILDTGEGIDISKDYFTPFYSTKSHNGMNTGLGLSLVYGIVTKYHGTISIKNRTDSTGCAVKMSFPLIESTQP
ncbi:MAG: ATP-binding cassette domain-containing protein [Sphaerochaetaceae bacterium]|nr:ATP-binding cassette domain-containing protein [Sphaerochaetaceae bacterium]